jgi:hypothetical protein
MNTFSIMVNSYPHIISNDGSHLNSHQLTTHHGMLPVPCRHLPACEASLCGDAVGGKFRFSDVKVLDSETT